MDNKTWPGVTKVFKNGFKTRASDYPNKFAPPDFHDTKSVQLRIITKQDMEKLLVRRYELVLRYRSNAN